MNVLVLYYMLYNITLQRRSNAQGEVTFKLKTEETL